MKEPIFTPQEVVRCYMPHCYWMVVQSGMPRQVMGLNNTCQFRSVAHSNFAPIVECFGVLVIFGVPFLKDVIDK